MVNEAKSLCIVWPLYAVYMTQKGFWLFFIAQLVTNYSLSASFASSAVLYLINRRARRELKGVVSAFSSAHYQLANRFHFFFG